MPYLRGLILILLVGIVLCTPRQCVGGVSPSPLKHPRVLVLYSNEQLLPAGIAVDNAIRSTFNSVFQSPVEFYAEFSDGDRQMLEWTQAASGAGLMMLVHHDDAKREFEYGRNSHIGTFSDSLMSEAKKSGWTVISMLGDWRTVFAFEKN